MSTPAASTYEFAQLDTSVQTTDHDCGDVVASARSEAEQIRERARQEGQAAGYEAGLAEARQESATLLRALADAVAQVSASAEEVTQTLSEQAAELALGVAEHVLAATIEVQPERIVEVTRGALRRLSERRHVTVVVNPEDLELLGGEVAALTAELGGIEHLDVQADRRIERGGCVARTAQGEIDVTITTQLGRAREIVAAALAGDDGA